MRLSACIGILVALTCTTTLFAQGRRGGGGGAATPPTTGPSPTQTSFKFSLGSATAPEGSIPIMPDTAYAPGKYGIDGAAQVQPVTAGDAHALAGPFRFSLDVPEGNYRVTVKFGDPAGGTSDTTIFAEARRLMVEKIHTDAGKTASVSFIVNYRNSHVPPPPANAPGGSEVRLNNLDNALSWDNKLTLQFANTHPVISEIDLEQVNVPTIFLAGDSTVTDGGGSWGAFLPNLFKDEVAIANHATSGETMKSFITGLRLDKILSQMKKGDYLLIQFGHNDEKQSWPQTYVEPETTFKAYISVFIAEARRRGATPVIISPMERRTGITGNSHGGFPQAYTEVAKEQNVAFIDLWAQSKIMYAAMGPDVAQAFNGSDATHHAPYGGYEIAKIIAQGLRNDKLDIAKSLKDDFKPFDPAHPDPFSAFTLPTPPR